MVTVSGGVNCVMLMNTVPGAKIIQADEAEQIKTCDHETVRTENGDQSNTGVLQYAVDLRPVIIYVIDMNLFYL